MRWRMRVFALPRLYRSRLAGKGWGTLADGNGYARFRLRHSAELAAVVSDQSERRARRPRGAHPRAESLAGTNPKPPNATRPFTFGTIGVCWHFPRTAERARHTPTVRTLFAG